jgi:hypothetical protein
MNLGSKGAMGIPEMPERVIPLRKIKADLKIKGD